MNSHSAFAGEIKPAPASLGHPIGAMRLIWKNPTTRRYSQVGRFEYLNDGQYTFHYSGQLPDDFSGLAEFPDITRAYVSHRLPAFFANRVMSRERRSYDDYLGWLGLDPDALPIEVLARTGGGRATDTFHVVSNFDLIGGKTEGRFFVSGVQHQPSGEAVASQLVAGDQLEVKEEPNNVYNDRALLLAREGAVLGWVPDWLLPDIENLREVCDLQFRVEKVNLGAPARLRVLVRFFARQR